MHQTENQIETATGCQLEPTVRNVQIETIPIKAKILVYKRQKIFAPKEKNKGPSKLH